MWWILGIIGYIIIGVFTMILINAIVEGISLLESTSEIADGEWYDDCVAPAGIFWPLAILFGIIIGVVWLISRTLKLIVKLCGGS
jgi:hypothetical protein